MSKIIKINRKIKKGCRPVLGLQPNLFLYTDIRQGLMLPARPCLLGLYGFIVSVLKFERATLVLCWSLCMLPTLAIVYCWAVFCL